METASQPPRESLQEVHLIRNQLQIDLAKLNYQKKHPELNPEQVHKEVMGEWLEGSYPMAVRFSEWEEVNKHRQVDPKDHPTLEEILDEIQRFAPRSVH